MRFRLLGPVEVDGRSLPLGGGRQRAVLAALLLTPNRVVTRRRLIELAWADPPESVQSNLRTYLGRLRRLLRVPGEAESRLVGTDEGYLVSVREGELDLDVFEALAAEGDAAAGEHRYDDARDRYGRALALWRGDPLEGVADGPRINAVITHLAERRRAVAGEHIRVRLALGEHVELAGELRGLVTAEPTRETLAGFLMLALYRSGRQDDALAVFRETRRRLVAGLGVEPGPGLVELHRRILRGDADLAVPEAGTAAAPASPVPEQLPADIPVFTGREAELTALKAAGRRAAKRSVVCAVDGMAGVGKSTLAVHAAHLMSAEFPDGRLYLDLHGFTGDVPPVEPAAALDRLLRALGVPGGQIPTTLDGLRSRFRRETVGMRLLILLDNAADAEQVLPLIPGHPGCFVLVTSRRRLDALGHRARLSLDVFTEEEAIALFESAAGPDGRGDAETAAAIVELCGRLPLAVRIAAARLRNRPRWTYRHLWERLSTERGALAELEAGERSVAAAVAVSYRDVDAAHRRMFRLLSLALGADVDERTAAALAGEPVDRARAMLAELAGAHLLADHGNGRYGFHDLVGEYAAQATESEDTAEERDASRRRLVEAYLHLAALAVGRLTPHSRRLPSALEPSTSDLPGFTGYDEAFAWAETEREALLAAVDLAVAIGAAAIAWRLAWALWTPLDIPSRTENLLAVSRTGLAAARDSGDVRAEGLMLTQLAAALHDTGRYREAIDHYGRSLEIARDNGDRLAEAIALRNLGSTYNHVGRHAEARETFLLAIARSEELDYPRLAGGCHRWCADACAGLGLIDEAARHLRDALAVHRGLGDKAGEMRALHGMGDLRLADGKYREALALLEPAAEYWERQRQLYSAALALNSCGAALRGLGDTAAAVGYHERALAIARRTKDGHLLCSALNDLGLTRFAAGEYAEALECHRGAEGIATYGGEIPQQVRARAGMEAATAALLSGGGR